MEKQAEWATLASAAHSSYYSISSGTSTIAILYEKIWHVTTVRLAYMVHGYKEGRWVFFPIGVTNNSEQKSDSAFVVDKQGQGGVAEREGEGGESIAESTEIARKSPLRLSKFGRTHRIPPAKLAIVTALARSPLRF